MKSGGKSGRVKAAFFSNDARLHGSDVIDYLEEYGGNTDDGKRTVIDAALATAEPCGGAGDLYAVLEETIAGKRRALPWPWATTLRCGSILRKQSVLALQSGARQQM